MVIDAETLCPLHDLTKEGEQRWNEFASKEFTFRNEHPFLSALKRIFQ